VNLFVKPACAGVSHCWRVSLYAVLWASDQMIGAGQMFHTKLITKPPSSPTLLPASPSLVRPLTPLAPRLVTKITHDDCTYKSTRHNNPEDKYQHLHCHENLKSHTETLLIFKRFITIWNYQTLHWKAITLHTEQHYCCSQLKSLQGCHVGITNVRELKTTKMEWLLLVWHLHKVLHMRMHLLKNCFGSNVSIVMSCCHSNTTNITLVSLAISHSPPMTTAASQTNAPFQHQRQLLS
jgi:hypothetical protein